jgi:hypothetical protein
MTPKPAKLSGMDVRLKPWSESALDLLRRINTPQMRRHVGGSNDWRIGLD